VPPALSQSDGLEMTECQDSSPRERPTSIPRA
jgi:hypothetical protein